ncbi:hypothetical protein BX600DRAFT_460927 [Xylariales sp. PMI_506]|nr:hypothetical protein BX600DRAFT_460927 [Xylariales sp. PMI_506]
MKSPTVTQRAGPPPVQTERFSPLIGQPFKGPRPMRKIHASKRKLHTHKTRTRETCEVGTGRSVVVLPLLTAVYYNHCPFSFLFFACPE